MPDDQIPSSSPFKNPSGGSLFPQEPRPTGRPVYESTLLAGRKRRRFSPWLVVPGMLIVLLGVFYFLVFGPKPRRFVPTAGIVVYASDSNSPGVPHLWTTKADGTGTPAQLTTGTALDTSPAFTADGSQIAFLSNRSGGPNQIWLVDGDGKNAIQITRTTGAKSDPIFAPGSSTLLGYLAGPALVIQEIGKGDPSQLLPAPGTAAHPSSTDPNQAQDTASAVTAFVWKPPADRASADQSNFGIAAVLENAGTQTLAVLPTLSSAPRLTQNDLPNGPPLAAADRVSPAYAPDGSKMAVGLLHVQGLPGGQRPSGLIQFDAAGSVVKPLLPLFKDPAVGPQDPVFSPDGTQLVFEVWSQTDLASRKVLGLYIVDADGSGVPHPLARGDAESAQFSPDGKQVFFLAGRAGGGHDLYRIGADGTGSARLSDGHADVTSFAISPQTASP